MVQDSRPLVETTRVPGIVESEQFEVQVMAELVAERAQKCSERGGLLQDRRSEPHADLLRFRIIVSEKGSVPQLSSRTRNGRAASTRTGAWKWVHQ